MPFRPFGTPSGSLNRYRKRHPTLEFRPTRSRSPSTLRWDAPLTREDGSRLYASDISGYRIYYRLRHRDSFEVISLSGDEDTRYQLEDFPPGAYEFSITALDDSGLESKRSDAVTVDLI